jgi:phosphoglycerate dehydrogenase-like enzyme
MSARIVYIGAPEVPSASFEQRVRAEFPDIDLFADHPLWREDRVVVTPLLGGMSDIYFEQAYPLVRDNLRLFLAGRQDCLTNVVRH